MTDASEGQLIEKIRQLDELVMEALAIQQAEEGDRRALADHVHSGKRLGAYGRALAADIIRDDKPRPRKHRPTTDYAAQRRAFNIAADWAAYGVDEVTKYIVGDLRDEYGCSERTIRTAVRDHQIEAKCFYAAIVGAAGHFGVDRNALMALLRKDASRTDVIRRFLRFAPPAQTVPFVVAGLYGLILQTSRT
jgi:hypothetical protein